MTEQNGKSSISRILHSKSLLLYSAKLFLKYPTLTLESLYLAFQENRVQPNPTGSQISTRSANYRFSVCLQHPILLKLAISCIMASSRFLDSIWLLRSRRSFKALSSECFRFAATRHETTRSQDGHPISILCGMNYFF